MTQRTEPAISAYIRPGEAARLAFISTKTLSRLGDEGKIRTLKLDSGHRRYNREDVLGLLTDPSTTSGDAA